MILESEGEPATKPGPIIYAKGPQKTLGGTPKKPVERYIFCTILNEY